MFVFFFLLDLILAGLLTAAGFLNAHRLDILYHSSLDEEKISFEEKLNEKSYLSRAMVSDYSVWDDTYSYLQGRLPDYPEVNITESSLGTFKTDAVWFYKTDFNLANNFSVSGHTVDFSPQKQKIIEKIASDKTVHFFVESNDGLWDIFGSTVVPSDDYEHNTKPAGYMFVGRLITQESLAELESVFTASVRLLKPSEIGNYPSRPPVSSGILAFNVERKDINGNLIAYIYVNYRTDGLRQIEQLGSSLLWLNGFSFLALIIIAYIAAWLWIIRPINAIYDGLEKSSTHGLEKLMSGETEFGKIAQLMDTFFKQQAAIKKEIAEKDEALTKIEKQAKELERTNEAMVNRELKMIELKEDIKELKASRKTKTDA